MSKKRSFKGNRNETTVPVIAAITDFDTQSDIKDFMKDLERIAPPGFIDDIHPEALVKIIGAHTIAHSELDIPINEKLQPVGLAIHNEELVLEFDDASAWMRDAKFTAINAMQNITGTRKIANADLNDLLRGTTSPAISLARVNRYALGNDAEYFTMAARSCIKEWFIDEPDSDGHSPRRPAVPKLLGFEALRLVRMAPTAHLPKNHTPYTRAPSKDFTIGLYNERFDTDLRPTG